MGENIINSVEFYKYLNDNLKKLCSLYNILNINDYFSLTDYQNPRIKSLSEVNQAFAQYILHAQNATIISSIVDFNKNFEFLKSTFCEFNPRKLLVKYEVLTTKRNIAIKRIIEDLRFNSDSQKGLKWDVKKSEKPDTIITRFANSVIDGALYFNRFNSKQEIIDDFDSEYKGNVKALISYTKKQFKHGFSVALCCDFLKELDSRFDLPKPDVHLMDVMAEIKGRIPKYYEASEEKAYECIEDFLSLVEQIKEDPSNSSLTAYKLDRIIWLCCTGDFFLEYDYRVDLKENLLLGFKKSITS